MCEKKCKQAVEFLSLMFVALIMETPSFTLDALLYACCEDAFYAVQQSGQWAAFRQFAWSEKNKMIWKEKFHQVSYY